MNLHKAIKQLQQSIQACTKLEIDPFVQQKQHVLADYRNQQETQARAGFHTAVKTLLVAAQKTTEQNTQALSAQLENAKTLNECNTLLDQLSSQAAETPDITPTHALYATLPTPILPADIRDEVLADFEEVHKCHTASCYRSVVILCGRLLETALHRKYYEATGNDLLEKAPGIGLGNLIAKLNERKIALDPALSNQIHLINQVRVFSVHKKNTPFNPSKEQAHAILLYTIDVFNKLFQKNVAVR